MGSGLMRLVTPDSILKAAGTEAIVASGIVDMRLRQNKFGFVDDPVAARGISSVVDHTWNVDVIARVVVKSFAVIVVMA